MKFVRENIQHKNTNMQALHKEHMLRPVEDSGKQVTVILAVYLMLIVFGIGTGYALSAKGMKLTGKSVIDTKGTVENDRVVGIQDASRYSDCPVGTLESGGIKEEGTHHLIRTGGPSQTAYLTSSLIDLDQYVGLTVKVCGSTMQARTAPWLMDVERLELQ